MIVSRRILTAARCSHCRSSVVRLFLASSHPLSRQTHNAIQQSGLVRSIPVRSYASTPGTSYSDEHSVVRNSTGQISHKHDEATESGSSDGLDKGDVPWYLQVEPPRHIPTTEPQPLPEVPENSPPIVSSLIKYTSEEMGLDELSLLDLRKLNPPPALGPNLYMLFGTARSERHLHVSAGRLVRWLKAKHRVYADADGLLGPNERKTKLRRKAKRARLLGTMGTDDADDGISTGWICVNLGTINRSHTESAVVGEDGRVAGFGVPQTGSTVVVQIMTEARRAELELEILWERALERQTKELPEKEIPKTANLHPLEQAVMSKGLSRPNLETSSFSDSPSSGQSRTLSSQTHQNDPIVE